MKSFGSKRISRQINKKYIERQFRSVAKLLSQKGGRMENVTEEDSNWSSGLTIWDFLHGTLRLNVPQSDITIGVRAYRDESEVRLAKVLVMPFRKQRPTWQLPENGEPSRAPTSASPSALVA
jgi:hypothetical protein